MIVSGTNLSLGSLFMSLLYRFLFALLESLAIEKEMKTILGLLWFLKLWITLYFPEFISSSCKCPLCQLKGPYLLGGFNWFPFQRGILLKLPTPFSLWLCVHPATGTPSFINELVQSGSLLLMMVLLRLGSTKTWCCAEANASLPETFCVVSGLLPGTICLWLNFIILNATLVSLGSFKTS